jgi:hypothetical protein
LVEYLLGNLMVVGSRSTCTQVFSVHRRKIPVARKTHQKVQSHIAEFFFACYMYELSLLHPVWVAEINVTACVRHTPDRNRVTWETPSSEAIPTVRNQ